MANRKPNPNPNPEKEVKDFNLGIRDLESNRATITNTIVGDKRKLLECLHIYHKWGGAAWTAHNVCEADVTRVIRTFYSLAGFSVAEEVITNVFDAYKTVLSNSIEAYALLLTMWKIQSGRQAKTEDGIPVAGALFHNQVRGLHTYDYADGSFCHQVNSEDTSFDLNISNAVWAKDYVGQLAYVYMTKECKKLTEFLFGNIFRVEMSARMPVYLNIWPAQGVEEEGLFNAYKQRIDACKTQLATYPLLDQIIMALGFENNSEFDFTRQLTQDRIYIKHDVNDEIKRFIVESCDIPHTEDEDTVANNYVLMPTSYVGNDATLRYDDILSIDMYNLRTLTYGDGFFSSLAIAYYDDTRDDSDANPKAFTEFGPVCPIGILQNAEAVPERDYADALTQAMLFTDNLDLDLPYVLAYKYEASGSNFVSILENSWGNSNVFQCSSDNFETCKAESWAHLLYGADYRVPMMKAIDQAAAIIKKKLNPDTKVKVE